MSQCVKCQANISDGKRFCRECWEAEMQKYREYKAEYDAKLAEWEAMPPSEKAMYNVGANEASLRKRTIAFFCLLAFVSLTFACVFGLGAGQTTLGFVMLGVAVVLIVGGIVLANVSMLFRRIFGKLFSILLGAIIGAVVGSGLASFISSIFEGENTTILVVCVGAALAIPILLGGFLGSRYIRKVKPTPPKMPSQASGTGATGWSF